MPKVKLPFEGQVLEREDEAGFRLHGGGPRNGGCCGARILGTPCGGPVNDFRRMREDSPRPRSQFRQADLPGQRRVRGALEARGGAARLPALEGVADLRHPVLRRAARPRAGARGRGRRARGRSPVGTWSTGRAATGDTGAGTPRSSGAPAPPRGGARAQPRLRRASAASPRQSCLDRLGIDEGSGFRLPGRLTLEADPLGAARFRLRRRLCPPRLGDGSSGGIRARRIARNLEQATREADPGRPRGRAGGTLRRWGRRGCETGFRGGSAPSCDPSQRREQQGDRGAGPDCDRRADAGSHASFLCSACVPAGGSASAGSSRSAASSLVRTQRPRLVAPSNSASAAKLLARAPGPSAAPPSEGRRSCGGSRPTPGGSTSRTGSRKARASPCRARARRTRSPS